MIIAGVGTRKGVDAAEVLGLIERALAEARIYRSQLEAIATAAGKAEEPGIVAAATQLGLRLLPMSNEAMQTAEGGITESSCSARLFGVSSVSEASALAAAGPGSELILPRIKSARATCALARVAGVELRGHTHGSDCMRDGSYGADDAGPLQPTPSSRRRPGPSQVSSSVTPAGPRGAVVPSSFPVEPVDAGVGPGLRRDDGEGGIGVGVASDGTATRGAHEAAAELGSQNRGTPLDHAKQNGGPQ